MMFQEFLVQSYVGNAIFVNYISQVQYYYCMKLQKFANLMSLLQMEDKVEILMKQSNKW